MPRREPYAPPAYRARRRHQLEDDINCYLAGEVRRRAVAEMLANLVLWGALGMLAWLVSGLWASAARAAECPEAPPAGENAVWTLPEGCPAPYELRAYTGIADLLARRNAARAKSLVRQLEVDLEACRAARDAKGDAAATKLEDGADAAEALGTGLADVHPPEAPPSTTRWAGLGALAAVGGGTVAYVALEPVGGRLQDVGGLAGAVVVGAVGMAVASLFE